MGKTTALLVGVCMYPAKGYPPLPCCANDVQAVGKALITGLNMPATNIRTCGHNGMVCLSDLLSGLNWAGSSVSEEDTFLFYFSGHGGSKILALSDGNLDLQSLIDGIETIPAKNKVIILDSCHSGDFAISDNPALDMAENIDAFVGHGYAVLASCGAEQTSGFNPERRLSTYTCFLVDALTARFLIREGKKSLESINEAISHFAKLWNKEYPAKRQTPIFRSNIGGTIFFDVEEYKPYQVASVYEETKNYIIYSVEPLHTLQAKRLRVKVILRYDSTYEEIADIAKEIKDKVIFADVYQNERSESHHKGKPANIVWCYFGYSEDDLVDGNYVCHTTWVDDNQNKDWWYREKTNSQVANGVYLELHTSYKTIYQMLHGEKVDREELVDKTRKITEKLINSAQHYIRLYREYRNRVLSEAEFIDAVEPINREITCLYFKQSELPYPPKEISEWSNAHTQLAATIQDFALYYDKQHGKTWTSEAKIQLMESTIRRYNSELEALRVIDKQV